MRAPAKNAPLHKTVAYFVQHHLGAGAFTAFTGQDWPAWRAFVYLVECWTHGGGDAAIAAMRATVRCAQPYVDILQPFVQAIPSVGDWPHVEQIWPAIAYDLSVIDRRAGGNLPAREIVALERWGVNNDHLTKHGWIQ